MDRPDTIGFIDLPLPALPTDFKGPDPFFASIRAHLPPPWQSLGILADGSSPVRDESGRALLPISDRKDRVIYANLSRIGTLLPGLARSYPYRSFYHQAFLRRAAARLIAEGAGWILFPRSPQWAPRIRRIDSSVKTLLWMPAEWLSAGPAYYASCLESVDRVLCRSGYIAEKILGRFPRIVEKLRILPLGVDTKLFSPPLQPACRHSILYVGNLSPEMGVYTLLEAFERLRVRYPDAQLFLIGPAVSTPPCLLPGASREDRRRWRQLGRGIELDLRRAAQRIGGVFLPGPVAPKSLPRLYRSSSLFVYPPFREDPRGSALPEAMACGLPVVASRSGGIPEVVEDNRTGLLVPPGDADHLIEAIERIFESRELASRLGAAARTKAETAYDWKILAGKVAETAAELRSGVT